MTAPPFHLAGPSINPSGHCSRDKSNYMLTHQLLHSSPSAGEKNIHTNLCSKKTPPTPIAHIWECWEDRIPCSAWAGKVMSDLLAKKKGQEREAEPQQEVEGQEWGQGQGWAGSPGCVVLHSTREDQGFSPGGLEPVSLLDQELSRKCYLHRTQQRFNTTLYTQNHYMLTR